MLTDRVCGEATNAVIVEAHAAKGPADETHDSAGPSLPDRSASDPSIAYESWEALDFMAPDNVVRTSIAPAE
jgi:hypothetical protein